jgi:hypothetical protein
MKTKYKVCLAIAGVIIGVVLTTDPQPNHKSSPGSFERQRAQERLEELAEMRREALADKMFGQGNHY